MLVCYPLKNVSKYLNVCICKCVCVCVFVCVCASRIEGFLLLEQVIEWNRKVQREDGKNRMDNDGVVECYDGNVGNDGGTAVVCMYFINKNLIIIFSFLPFQLQLFFPFISLLMLLLLLLCFNFLFYFFFFFNLLNWNFFITFYFTSFFSSFSLPSNFLLFCCSFSFIFPTLD